jgi:hypothetical protein
LFDNVDNTNYYRFDGPALSSVVEFATQDSSGNIINPTDDSTIQKWNIMDHQMISKIRLIRVNRSYSSATDSELVLTQEIQLWVGGINIASRNNGGVASISKQHLSRNDAGRAINDTFGTTDYKYTRSGWPYDAASYNYNIGQYIEISLDSSVSVNQIQSMVHYSYEINNTSTSRDIGTQLQLIDHMENVIYNTLDLTDRLYYPTTTSQHKIVVVKL